MSSRVAILLLPALVAAGCDRQSPAPVQANDTAATSAPDEVASEAPTGPIAQGLIDKSHRGEAAPTVAFTAPDGKSVTLASFKGRPVLLNLWATWCAPCVAEMPTLDAAAAKLGDDTLVLAVSQDMQADKVAPYFAKAGLKALEPYRDPEMALSLAYKVNLPTTVLLDSEGREVWRMTGTRDWASAESLALIAGNG